MTISDSTEDTDPSEESKMNVEDIVPFSVFRKIGHDDHCDGKHPGSCKALDRMITALDYHQFVIMNPMNDSIRHWGAIINQGERRAIYLQIKYAYSSRLQPWEPKVQN